jgi:hypothetical protein
MKMPKVDGVLTANRRRPPNEKYESKHELVKVMQIKTRVGS